MLSPQPITLILSVENKSGCPFRLGRNAYDPTFGAFRFKGVNPTAANLGIVT